MCNIYIGAYIKRQLYNELSSRAYRFLFRLYAKKCSLWDVKATKRLEGKFPQGTRLEGKFPQAWKLTQSFFLDSSFFSASSLSADPLASLFAVSAGGAGAAGAGAAGMG